MEILSTNIIQYNENGLNEKIVAYEVLFENNQVQKLEFAVDGNLTDEEAKDKAWESAKDVIEYLHTQNCYI